MDWQVRRVLIERPIAIENGAREIKPIADVRAQCCPFKDIAHRDGDGLDTRCEEFLFRLARSRSLRRNAFCHEVPGDVLIRTPRAINNHRFACIGDDCGS